MQCLVIGYGSMGSRHARLLAAMGHEVRCQSSNAQCGFPNDALLSDAMKHNPELVIVANATIDHLDTLQELKKLQFKGLLLVEAPLFGALPSSVPTAPETTFIAYNLRLHPLVERIRTLTKGKFIHSARLNVGQYLPDRHPDGDYADSHSAHRNRGGGVLRDLSQELDLATWLFGPWREVTAIGGHFSDLKIDSDDVFSVLMTTNRCPAVSVHMDYLSRIPHRTIEINAENMTLHADFMAGKIKVNGDLASFEQDRDETYIAQLQALTNGNTKHLCSYEQGVAVLNLIEAIELAAQQRTWVGAQ